MSTVHLVYPHGPGISCPDAIGRQLAERLGRVHRVILHDWDEVAVIRPRPDSVLLGHPHPAPWTIFRMSSRLRGWRRVLALTPFAHGDPAAVAYLDSLLRRCDQYLAITGRYWFRSVAASPVAHWAPKMVHLDLAVDRADFPRVKHEFAPPGRRRFLYIGSTHPYKNVEYLSAIAERTSGGEFTWIGLGSPIRRFRPLGFQDFRTVAARQIVADHDFLLTVGRVDANPATILEAMAWGLIPICTPQSGYDGEPGIVNVPLGDAAAAAAILDDLQRAPAERLLALRAAADHALASRFTWERFAAQVQASIESSDSPSLGRESLGDRLRLRLAAARAPHSILRPDRACAHVVGQLARMRAWARARR